MFDDVCRYIVLQNLQLSCYGFKGQCCVKFRFLEGMYVNQIY